VGGSLARALTKAGYRVTGIDWPLVVRRALRARAIAAGATRTEAGASADVVVLAAPPATTSGSSAGWRGWPVPAS